MADGASEGFGWWEPLISRLFEEAPGFLAVMEGPEHVLRLTNAAYRRMVGERRLEGLTVREAFPELEGTGVFELLDEVVASGKPHFGRRAPVPLRTAAGTDELRYLDFVYQPILAADGSAAGIFCQGNDVTELVLSEIALAEKAKELAVERQVFDIALSFSEDFNYIFDTEGRFTFVNKTLLDLWGMTLGEAVGKTFFELPYTQELAQRLHDEIHSVVATGVQVRNQTYYQAPSGADGWFEYIFNPVFDAAGQVVCVAGSTRDVTQRIQQERQIAALVESERAARAEAERAGRVKDQFLATLSHELRTPLNSILGWAEMLRSGRLDQSRAADAIERIVHNGKAQGQLIADLLDMNAIASAKLRLVKQRLPLQRPLQAALDLVLPDAVRKGVTIVPPGDAQKTLIDGDPDRLQQVFWNLLANAIKFTPEGGVIALEVDASERRVCVAISDSGAGIDVDFLPHLFERFSQADGSVSRSYRGLGLGLSICKSFVEMHGGTIEAHSDGPGLGATFLVTLPFARAASDGSVSSWGELDSGALPIEEGQVLEGLPVLLVDDDAEGRSFVRRLLEEYGAHVTECESAEAALAALGRQFFGLMISDVGMPGMDGYSLMRKVRSRASGPRLPAIALTAYARKEDEAMAIEAGFDGYLAKPAPPGRIVSACLRVVGREVHS